MHGKGPMRQNKPNIAATMAKHPDSHSQISCKGLMQPTYMHSVSFWGKFTSSSHISASHSDLPSKVPIMHFLKGHSTPSVQYQRM